jgi:hypothetical protein
MKTENTISAVFKVISWLFGSLFFVIGILNLFLVHPVPGIFYLLISLTYLPQTNNLFKKKIGFPIPLKVKVLVGFVILWGTLAVGELADILGL